MFHKANGFGKTGVWSCRVLANTIATGRALVALILTFGPKSGAHLNPVVTLADATEGGLRSSDTPHHVAAQILGAVSGTLAAH
jgi:glycerol uptake facilitator-like aquaporin